MPYDAKRPVAAPPAKTNAPLARWSSGSAKAAMRSNFATLLAEASLTVSITASAVSLKSCGASSATDISLARTSLEKLSLPDARRVSLTMPHSKLSASQLATLADVA